MGLDAYVRCNCVERGKANPHPFPELLVFDASHEPRLRKGAKPGQWIKHDRWLANSCQHGGIDIAVRIGNVSQVARLRESVRQLGAERFPILLARVLMNGTHGGDSIPVRMVHKLKTELGFLEQDAADDALLIFTKNMSRLCRASLKNCKPIMF